MTCPDLPHQIFQSRSKHCGTVDAHVGLETLCRFSKLYALYGHLKPCSSEDKQVPIKKSVSIGPSVLWPSRKSPYPDQITHSTPTHSWKLSYPGGLCFETPAENLRPGAEGWWWNLLGINLGQWQCAIGRWKMETLNTFFPVDTISFFLDSCCTLKVRRPFVPSNILAAHRRKYGPAWDGSRWHLPRPRHWQGWCELETDASRLQCEDSSPYWRAYQSGGPSSQSQWMHGGNPCAHCQQGSWCRRA